ncbi:non-ribosomal peptide synthetase [Stenotrophomonas rhizophila]|uniref:non-ribosomal peptide synthetase n=1 Tax=Stenotrophomonas rhizophila TaxID=216778 RepID=UPI001E63F486|nr:non-ribosomal peptide synthetase [Stenotrophomonas rhizophila]MCC7633951.1 amino acid adenylation domain-containing protein [Stenotrophomonas rhizophila]MCC7663285.1 amino acid adenylation domain-containing protein [Stenotrophomonas rhizophila]
MNAGAVPATAASIVHGLSEAQAGLWYAQRLAPDNPAFNTAHAVWIEGALDVAAFAHAADQAAQEAEALALRIVEDAQGVPGQWVDRQHTPMLQVLDLSDLPDPAAAAREAMQRDRLSPVDPARDRLSQQRLFLLGPARSVWYLRVHHLATDGYGMGLLTERVCALYAGGAPQAGLAPLLPVLDEDIQYRDSERRLRDAAYWRDAMADAPAATGLQAGVAPAAPDALRHVQPTDPALRERLHAAATAIGQPWPDLLTALGAEYCRRISGAAEAVIGVPFMGRLGSVSARVPAMVMNALPLRVAAAQGSVDDYVRDIALRLVRGRRHGRYRGEQLRRDLGLIGGQRRLHGPLVNVQPFYRPLQLAGVTATLEVLSTGPVDDVTLGFRGDGTAVLDLEIEANPTLYTPGQVQAHAARLLHFVSAALEVQAAGGAIAAVPLCTPAEAQRYLYDINATAHPVPEVTLATLIAAQMAATPTATAVVFGVQQLTFAELERRSRALALQLQAQGVGREARVVVALPRSLELIIALVAVLRAGGAYLPVDLAHPDERLARILRSAQPACVLALAQDRARFPDTPVLDPSQWQRHNDAALTTELQPDDAAYVIYTSGSTGEPKGVLIEHRAIVNRLEWMREHYAIQPDERILQKTPATFDVSVWEFFLPLISGATLVVAPPEAHRDPLALAALIRQHAITTLHFVPSMLAAFLAAPAARGLRLRRVFTSGEALDAALRDRFHATLQAELHNLYGPTEAAVDVSFWPAGQDDTSAPVPIGHPVWNTRLYVLDARMLPLPPGVAGDLYLGGVQLARGYLGRDDLTAERFLPDPFVAGGRLYRTGDVARWREDGAVEYLGRNDHQIKLRGLRIELGEIDAALRSAPGVTRAEVLLREDRPGEPRLVAYLDAGGPDLEMLRRHLAGRLPDYMVPGAFVELPQWPVTANGKLDRAALPAPAQAPSSGEAPRSATEQALAALFAQTLALDTVVSADADFFALGGDSLSAVHLLLAIQQRWRCDLGLGAVFAAPTVAALAARIDAPPAATDHGLAPMIRLTSGDAALAPLYVIHPAGGIAWNYRDLARALSPAREVQGLQSPALDPTRPLPASIEALAADYAERILALGRPGPVHLLGWSVGGILAQAMAVHLRARGHEVGVLALLDAYPSECWRAEPEPDPVAALRALLAIAGHDPDAHPELDSRARILAFLRRGDSALGNLPDVALDGVVRAVTGTNRLIRAHHHTHYDGPLLHVRAGRDHAARPQLQSTLWQAHAASVEAIELPYLHAELTGRDAVAQIAPWLAAHLRRHDAHRTPA